MNLFNFIILNATFLIKQTSNTLNNENGRRAIGKKVS